MHIEIRRDRRLNLIQKGAELFAAVPPQSADTTYAAFRM
jgi:hypothetical protein